MQNNKQLWLGVLGATLLLPNAAFADISGKVFRDFNANGIQDSISGVMEPGVGGINVTCSDISGNTETVISSSVLATLGEYKLTGCSGKTRIEFSGLSNDDYPASTGSGNKSSVQFVDNAATDVNFAVSMVGDYYGSSSPAIPNFATSIMTNGDQSSGAERTLVTLPFNASAGWQGDVNKQAVDTETGSIYGIAYKKDTQQIFSSAYLKRHVGLGPDGLGAIYVTTRGQDDTQLFVNLQTDLGINVGNIDNNAVRGLAGLTAPSHDVEAFNKVGKFGIGDIDLSADGKTLYVTNLYDQKLYAIKIDSDNNPLTKPTPADVISYAIPAPASCSAMTRTHIRSNFSGSRHVQADGAIWMAGAYSFDGQNGETTDDVDVSAPGSADKVIYQTWRDHISSIRVPLQNGTYSVKLHFADFWGAPSPGGRRFDINFENGQVIEDNFNIYEAANGNGKAVVKTYTVTINDSQLDVEFSNAVNGSAMISAIEVIGNTDVQAGNWRPFAIGTEGHSIFVGGVCDALNSQNPEDLKATIYRLDTSAGNFTTVLDVPLDYQKGFAYGGACAGQRGWFGWLPDNVFPPICDANSTIIAYPQPMLVDIDFAADRSMLLSFRDRLGDQTGQDNYTLSGITTVVGLSAGDILRAGKVGNAYELESNATVSGLTSAGSGNNQGPGGGEFYYQDNFGTGHEETGMGGLASHKGVDQLLLARIDTENTIKTGGVSWLNNQNGQSLRDYSLYGQDAKFMGKSTGLGDIELLLDPAPIEIGNRVWLDTNGNGIQDAGENGIPGISVELRSGATVLATVTTAADGTYYFSSATGTDTASVKYGLTQLQPNTAYTVKFPTNVDVSGTTYNLTTANAGGNRLIDSNAAATGDVVVNATDIPTSGANNHSFDVGYSSMPPPTGCTTITNNASITQSGVSDPVAGNNNASAAIQVNCVTPKTDLKLVKTASKTTVRKGDSLTYTITLINESDVDATGVVVNDKLPSAMTYADHAPAAANYNSTSGDWTVGTVPARQTLILNINTKVN